MTKPISVRVNCGGVRHRIELTSMGRICLCDHSSRQLLRIQLLAPLFPEECHCRCLKVRESWAEYLKTGERETLQQLPKGFRVAAEEALAVKHSRKGGV